MNPKSCIVFFVAASLLSLLSGCTGGKRPFLIVQLCLGNEQNLGLFVDTMKSISQSAGMDYGGNGAETQKGLVRLKASPNYRLIQIAGERKDGVGWAAGNLGLSAYEVAVGFTEGTNPTEAHRFADTVVAALKKKWTVYTVPPDRGALPLKACQTTSAEPNGG